MMTACFCCPHVVPKRNLIKGVVRRFWERICWMKHKTLAQHFTNHLAQDQM